MTTAEKYVAAAYLVVFAVVLAYVLIISLKLVRLEREVEELTELARQRRARLEAPRAQPRPPRTAPMPLSGTARGYVESFVTSHHGKLSSLKAVWTRGWRPSYLACETSSFASPPRDGFAMSSLMT